MGAFAFLRSAAVALPPLAKFALGMVIIFGIPPLSRRVRLPAVVGLLLSGVVVGPHVLGIFGEQRPIADFLADLGKLLLMFVAGLEIDLAHFRQAQGQVHHLRSHHHRAPFTAGHGCWPLLRLWTHRGDRRGITARIAYAPRVSDRG